MAKILNKQDVKAILYGACLMGAGGGGSLESGLMLLDSYAKKREIAVKMISMDEMESGSYAGVVAGMGSPVRFKERGADFSVEPVVAYDALKKVAFFMNRKITTIMAVEYGALNSFVPMMVAMENDEPFIDADGTGRAVPALNTLLFDVNGIATAPNVMTNAKGDVMINYPVDPHDAKGLENIGRYVCQAFDMIMGISGWMSSKEEINNLLVPGGYTHALKVGNAMLDAMEKKLDVAAEISKAAPFRELWRGKLTKVETHVAGGFDIGRTYFEGTGSYAGKTYKVDYKNENLVAFEGAKPLITVPDIICFINLDTGDPMSNADVAEGQNVLVGAMPVHENWFKTSRGVDCWKPFLDAIDYTGKIIRY